MSDPSRPPAPFLPPEIISRIILLNHPKLFAYWPPHLVPLSRISSAWTVEVQRRLFESITIQSSTKLLKLVLALESAPRLGQFILSLRIEPRSAISPINDAHLVFKLLSSIPNLTDFTFVNPSFDSFSQEDSTAMQLAPPLLPNLTTLRLDAGQDNAWKREVFDEILINAPNVTELSLEGKASYQGPMWRSHIPAKLKKLITGQGPAILEGKIWPIASQGLESLSLDCIREIDSRDSFLPFFEAVGPTLVEMDCRNLPTEVYPLLIALERLEVTSLPLDDSSPPKLLLPSTLISLKISHWGFFDRESRLPVEAWSHLTLLDELHLEELYISCDLNQLPPLKKIVIHHCHEESLLRSMRNLIAGQFFIGELELLEIYRYDEEREEFLEDFDGEETRKRCEELGINYTLDVIDY